MMSDLQDQEGEKEEERTASQRDLDYLFDDEEEESSSSSSLEKENVEEEEPNEWVTMVKKLEKRIEYLEFRVALLEGKPWSGAYFVSTHKQEEEKTEPIGETEYSDDGSEGLMRYM